MLAINLGFGLSLRRLIPRPRLVTLVIVVRYRRASGLTGTNITRQVIALKSVEIDSSLYNGYSRDAEPNNIIRDDLGYYRYHP